MTNPREVAHRLMGWKSVKVVALPADTLVEVLIRHCNKELREEDHIVQGWMGDDGFYFSDGGELAHNWNILEWREV